MTGPPGLPEGSVETRRLILALVEKYPGLHLREIQRRADTSPMLAEYHLNVLEKMGLVTSEDHAGYRNFFPARHAPMQLNATDKRWLAMLRRPLVLGMVLSMLETGPTRAVKLAQAARVPSSTALYQLKGMKAAGIIVQGDELSPNRIRLADPDRVLELLRTYHPLPDAHLQFAEMWSKAIAAFQPPETPIEPVPDLPQRVDMPDKLASMPPSVQAVYAALVAGPLTGKDICLETGLARRTVYTSLIALRDHGLLREQPNLSDMRQRRFSLNSP
jgi:DNA-binding transcriptional ArsR family regulator